jgi:hypothetical protein
MERTQQWATAVRVLAVVTLVLTTFSIVAGIALRRARAEIQQLRSEREQVKSGVAATWAQQPIAEFQHALRELNAFFEDDLDGMRRPGGLCAGGRLDDEAVAAYAVGSFLVARAAGRSVPGAVAIMKAEIQKTDAFRALHPAPGAGRGK